MFTGSETLNRMDSMIQEKVKDIEFWGQLDISKEELERLRERIATFLERGMGFKDVFKQYPYATVSYIVFLTKYQYNGDFWGMISDAIGIEKLNGSEQSQIGGMILSTFKKNGFDYTKVHDNARKYVDSVIYEIGEPPESNLQDLFYIFKYGSMGNADPQILADQITSNVFSVHKPLLYFLLDTEEDISANFILDIQETYLSAVQTGDLSGKYARAYAEWVEIDKEKSANRNKNDDEKVEVRPSFSFDNGKKGLCVVLPRQDMEEEWVETAKWQIIADDDSPIVKECNVQGSEGKRFTEQIVVPVRPCSNYKLYFEYDDGFDTHTTPYELKGIGEGQFFYFNAKGKRISPSYLRTPYAILIYSKEYEIDAVNMSRDIQSYPMLTDDYRVEQISPIYTDSQLTIDTGRETVVLRMKPQINVTMSGKGLFGCDYIESEVPIFTEIPELHMTFEGYTTAEGIELRIGDTILETTDLDVEYENIQGIENAFDKEVYGIISVRIYQFGRFVQQVKFCLLPDFVSSFAADIVWPGSRTKLGMRHISIQKVPGWDIKFNNASVQDLPDKYEISIPYSEGTLQGTVVSRKENLNLSVDFQLPVCAYKTYLISSNELSEKCDLKDFLDANPWESISFYGQYAENQYTVKLTSTDGVEQEQQIKLSSNGAVNIDLNVFRDTVQRAPLPVKISVHNDDTGEEFNLLVIDEKVKFLKRPAYVRKRNEVGIWSEDITGDAVIEKYGDRDFSYEIYYQDSTEDERGWRVFKLKDGDELSQGYYRIVRETNIGDLLVMEDRFTISMKTDQFFVTAKPKTGPIDDFNTWLERVISDLLKYRGPKHIEDITKTDWYLTRGLLFKYEVPVLKDEDILNLVILGSMLEAKISRAHKAIIEELMKLISTFVLTNADRYRIIRSLVVIKANELLFESCIKNYALVLFDYGQDQAPNEIKETAIAVKRYSSKLSLMMLMKLNVPIRETLGDPTYRDIIGSEAVISMMKSEKPEELQNEDRKHFLLEDGESTVHIGISEELSGINQFYEMIVERGHRMFLDKKKIPDHGIHLNGSRYNDLFVNWYVRNYPRGESIKQETSTAMRESFAAFLGNVYNKLHLIAVSDEIGQYLREYDSVLAKRRAGDGRTFSLPNYFYFVALSALIVQLPVLDEYKEIWESAQLFYIRAIPIAPYISSRDYLMAATFVYLRGKER